MLVKGMAGIGKTALALAFVEAVRRDCPGKTVRYARCLPGQGLDEVARQVLDTPTPSGADIHQTLLALVQHLNRSDTLLLLDDVHVLPPDELTALVRMLQAFLSGHALLTSREDLPLPADEVVDVLQVKLEGLAPAAAQDLLRGLLALHPDAPPVAPAAMERIAAGGSGHPYLLRLLASLVVTRALDPDRVAREGVPAEIRASLVPRAVGEIVPDERAVVEVLALARSPLADDALTELAGVSDARTALASLERKLLVERQSGDRMGVHQLLADHVQAAMAAPRRIALHRALARGCEALGQKQPAFHHLVEGEEVDAAARLLETEAARLCATGQYALLLDDVRRLEAAGGVVPGRARLAQANALSILGRAAESLAILGTLTADPSLRIEALACTAGTHLNSGHFARALACYAETMRLGGRDASPELTTKCLNYTALIRGYRGELRTARDLLERSLALARRSGSRAALAHALRIQATLHALAQACDAALPPARESLAIATDLGSTRTACWARYALALACLGRGELNAAREALEENLRVGRRSGDRHVQAYAHLELGRMAEGAPAIASLQSSLAAFEEQGDGMGAAMAQLRLGTMQGAQGRPLLERVVAAASERDNPRLEAEAHLALAELDRERGSLEEARAQADAALQRLSDLDLPWLAAEAHLRLAEDAARRARPDVAERHLREAGGRGSESLQARVAAAMARRYRVITSAGATLEDEAGVARARASANACDFFLDAPARRLRVEGREDVPIFRRPIVFRLLLALLGHLGEGLAPEEIVPLVWGTPYEGESSALELRKAVSRLRELLETDRAHPRYVRHHEASLSGRGRYSLQPGESFCAILEA